MNAGDGIDLLGQLAQLILGALALLVMGGTVWLIVRIQRGGW